MTDPKPTLPTRWAFASLVMPFAGIVCGFFFALYLAPLLPSFVQPKGHGKDLAWVAWTWGACCVLGLVFAGISRARNERLRGVTWTGFVLNGLLPGAALIAAVAFLADWLQVVANDMFDGFFG